MELRERMVGHQREHVVLKVIVHVPIQVPVYAIHVDRPAVEAVVEDVFCKARMLRQAVDDHEPSSEEVCEAHEEQGKNAAGVNKESDGRGVDGYVDAGVAVDLSQFDLGYEGPFVGRGPADGVVKDFPKVGGICPEIEEA